MSHVCRTDGALHVSPLSRTKVQYIIIVVIHGSNADMMGFVVFPSISALFCPVLPADERGSEAGAAHADSGLLLSVRGRVGVRDWRHRLCRQEQRAQRQDL